MASSKCTPSSAPLRETPTDELWKQRYPISSHSLHRDDSEVHLKHFSLLGCSDPDLDASEKFGALFTSLTLEAHHVDRNVDYFDFLQPEVPRGWSMWQSPEKRPHTAQKEHAMLFWWRNTLGGRGGRFVRTLNTHPRSVCCSLRCAIRHL